MYPIRISTPIGIATPCTKHSDGFFPRPIYTKSINMVSPQIPIAATQFLCRHHTSPPLLCPQRYTHRCPEPQAKNTSRRHIAFPPPLITYTQKHKAKQNPMPSTIYITRIHLSALTIYDKQYKQLCDSKIYNFKHEGCHK
jgi:hypothetical protein